MFRRFLMTGIVVAAGLGLAVHTANSHALRFERTNSTFHNPHNMINAQLAFAWFATIQYPGDVYYYVFVGEADEEISLHLLFPQIEGNPPFYPTLALIGPGLPDADLPYNVQAPYDSGVVFMEYGEDDLVEAYHGRAYLSAPPLEITLPVDGQYYVAIWHSGGEIGRYVFSHGWDHEGIEGDPDADEMMEKYWTPILSSTQHWELYD